MFTVSIHINTSKYKLVLVLMFVLVLVFVPVSMSEIAPLLVLASVLMLGLISANIRRSASISINIRTSFERQYI